MKHMAERGERVVK